MLRRGTKRQLIWSLAVCLCAALLLLPVIIWYYFRFRLHQLHLASFEIWGVLLYVIVFGWLLPLGITCLHWYATTISATTTKQGQSVSQQNDPLRAVKLGRMPVSATVQPPCYQPGVVPAYVYSEDAPWGWLEYRTGNFQGQRLALKRSIITIGRDEHCDIWLDDDLASRHHAELAWCDDQICLTDCQSLNGVFLNGHPVKGSVQVESEDSISIGEHQFVFLVAERIDDILLDLDDPLVRHTWRTTLDDLASDIDTSSPLPAAPVKASAQQEKFQPQTAQHLSVETDHGLLSSFSSQSISFLFIRNGETAGQYIALDASMVTIGSGSECTLVVNDASVSRVQAQIVYGHGAHYIIDLDSRNRLLVNNEPLQGPHILKAGDIICIGNMYLEYSVGGVSGGKSRTTSPSTSVPPLSRSMSGPMPLRLPSKMKPR